MTTHGTHPETSAQNRHLGALALAEGQSAISGGAAAFISNPTTVGPGAAVSISQAITPKFGGRILVWAVLSGVASAAVAGAVQIKRGTTNIGGTPTFATGSDSAHTWQGAAIALDTAQPAGTSVTYSATASVGAQTLTSTNGELTLLVLEIGPGT